MGSVKDVNSKEEVENLVKDGSAVMLHFWASWCDASKHMDQVFSHLSTDFPNAHFLRVEAEEQPEISEAYSVSAVPFFVFIKDGKKVDTLEGAYPAELANKVSKVVGSIHAGEPAAPASLGMAAGPSVLEAIQDLAKVNSSPQGNTHPSPPAGVTDLNTRLEKLTRSHPIMLFMKGTPEQPKCGFSKKTVEILKAENVKFGTFDILSDNEGTPDAPECGFSSKVVNALKEEGIKFGSFDIYSDEEVRQGLKTFSNWPTFPQLYYKE
nr:monothiol glutaredoxin-S17 [Tanacetum cinerariifolium]